MYKVSLIFIAFTLIVFSSCSIVKREAKSKGFEPGMKTDKFLNEISDNNLLNENFRFDRVKVIMTEGGETRRFTANIRYSREQKFLVSVRIIASIEIARIYVDENTIIVLDRFNRNYLTGNTGDLLAKYGLNWNDFPLMFGDLPETATSPDKIKCVNGKVNVALNTIYGNYQAGFDCSMKKLTRLEGKSSQYAINMEFSDFSNSREALYPTNSLFRETKSGTRIDFNFSGYSGFNGIIEKPEKPTRYDIGKIR